MPPAQQDYAGQQHEGLNVVWSLTFSSIHPQNDDQVNLTFGYKGFFPWTYCIVDINEYPEIKTTPKDKTVWVAGTITNVKGHEISLRDVKLRFI